MLRRGGPRYRDANHRRVGGRPITRSDTSTSVTVGSHAFDTIRNATASAHGVDPDAGVLLLHGFPQSKASWSPVLAQLDAAGVGALAFDQRGYSSGARPTAVQDYGMDHLVGDVIGVMDAIGLRKVHLVGHDWGALVAWAVAARHPERLRSLIAVSVPHPAAFEWAKTHDPDQRERSGYVDFFRTDPLAAELMTAGDGAALRLGFGDVVSADLIDEHLRTLLEPGAMDAALNWYRAAEGHHEIGPVTVPTCFVWGVDDIAVARSGVERCAAHVTADYRFIELTDTGHWIPEHRPDIVTDAVLTHLVRR